MDTTAQNSELPRGTSRMFSLLPLIGSILAAENMMRPMQSPWRAVNEEQRHLLDIFVPVARALVGSIPEFSFMASWTHTELMDFLAQHGVSIAIDPFDPDKFGTAAVMSTAMRWQQEGELDVIFKDNQSYPAFRLKGEQVAYFTSPATPNPIARITAQNGDQVFVCNAHPDLCELADEIGMNRYATFLLANLSERQPFSGVKMPMVNFDETRDVPWLVGLNADTAVRGLLETTSLFQAKQRLIWKMGRKGAILRTGAYAGFTFESCCLSNDLEINNDFLVIVRRPGVTNLPLAVGIITPDDWKDPGEIE